MPHVFFTMIAAQASMAAFWMERSRLAALREFGPKPQPVPVQVRSQAEEPPARRRAA